MKITTSLRLLAGLAALGAGFLSASAQSTPAAPATAPAAAGAAKPRLHRGAALSDEQRQQFTALREQQRERIRAIRDDTSLTPEQRREKIRESLRTARDEAAAVLTPEQKAKLQKFRHRARLQRTPAMHARAHRGPAAWHQRPGGLGHRFAPGAPGRFQAMPGFDRARGQGFGPGRGQPGPMAFGQRGPGIGADGFAGLNLSDEQKSQLSALREAHRTQLQATAKSFQEQILSVLTPEQQQKLDARRSR